MKLHIIVYRMEFDKTSWSCSWNSDQNCTQNSARGVVGAQGVGGSGVQGVVEAQGWWGPRGVVGAQGMRVCLI